jgi:hypothetical protein
MIAFKPMSLTEQIKRLWPAYRRRREAEMKEAIRQLVADPSLPCMVGGHFISSGYGRPVDIGSIRLDGDRWTL